MAHPLLSQGLDQEDQADALFAGLGGAPGQPNAQSASLGQQHGPPASFGQQNGPPSTLGQQQTGAFPQQNGQAGGSPGQQQAGPFGQQGAQPGFNPQTAQNGLGGAPVPPQGAFPDQPGSSNSYAMNTPSWPQQDNGGGYGSPQDPSQFGPAQQLGAQQWQQQGQPPQGFGASGPAPNFQRRAEAGAWGTKSTAQQIPDSGSQMGAPQMGASQMGASPLDASDTEGSQMGNGPPSFNGPPSANLPPTANYAQAMNGQPSFRPGVDNVPGTSGTQKNPAAQAAANAMNPGALGPAQGGSLAPAPGGPTGAGAAQSYEPTPCSTSATTSATKAASAAPSVL
ncbi:hypothetical protein CBER1_11797 [Cercospora berteroae]|uniref:Uncharacterized protein n=1 Tax=Cercospora berteroae TaxID=357750 RepID=A0A2S6C0Q8_9PEZI|nr:hypothetical protein CBER1_11797 [Cercospora berteroae]